MRKVLNLGVAVIVLVIGGAIGWNVFQEQRARLRAEAEEAERKPPKRQTALRPVTPPQRAKSAPAAAPTTPASGPNSKKSKAEQSATPEAPPPKQYTWKEIEAELDRLRGERSDRPDAQIELYDWYLRMARPEFTSSADIPEHCGKLAAWREEMPDSPTPLIALARAHINYAWEARGGGFADTVTTQGWELFHSRIAEAHRQLDAAVAKGVKDGAAHAALLNVARAEGASIDEARAALEAGQKVDPTFYELYTAMTEYLLPRWHGEPGDVERFAAEVANSMTGDPGLEAYAYIALHIKEREPEMLFWGEFDRDLLAQSAEVLAKRHPTNHMLTAFAAYIAWLNQDHEQALRMQTIVGPKPDARVWDEYHAEIWREWCSAKVLPPDAPQKAWGTLGYRGSIALSRDGQEVWCGTNLYSRPVHLIELKTGKPSMSVVGNGFGMLAVDFDARRNWVFGPVSGGPADGVVLWKLDDDGTPAFIATPAPCVSAALHPMRNEIAVSYGNSLAIYELGKQAARATIDLSSPATRLLYSDDGALLLTSGRDFSVWDASSGEKKYDLATINNTRPLPSLNCKNIVAFDDDGCVLAVADDRHVGAGNRYLVKFSPDGQQITKLREEPLAGWIRLSPDRTLLATIKLRQADAPTRIEVRDMKSQTVIQEIEAHWGALQSVVIAADNSRLAALGEDGIVCAWPIEVGAVKDSKEE